VFIKWVGSLVKFVCPFFAYFLTAFTGALFRFTPLAHFFGALFKKTLQLFLGMGMQDSLLLQLAAPKYIACITTVFNSSVL